MTKVFDQIMLGLQDAIAYASGDQSRGKIVRGYLCDNKRHLICVPYSIEALHEMAFNLGIGRHWYHASQFPHYDIPKRRIKEIMSKCTLISTKELLLNIIKSDWYETTHSR